MNKKYYRAHQVGWFFTHGTWPISALAHCCDVPLCVNPFHLFEASQSENMRDMSKKNRAFQQKTNFHTRQTIFKRLQNGESVKTLMQEYGVSRALIYQVKAGQRL